MRKKIVVLCLCFMLSASARAEIAGHVAAEYDAIGRDWSWTLNVEKHITDWWLVGTSMATYAPGYSFKYFVPSWIPHRLDYEVYTELRLGDWSLRVTDWCDHWFSQSGVSGWDDHHGLTVRLKYEF